MPGLEPLPRRIEEQVELAERRSAKSVDQHEQLGTLCRREIRDDGFEQLAADGVRGAELCAAPSGLAVDSYADFHFIIADAERRGAGGGHDAARKGDAHRGSAPDD